MGYEYTVAKHIPVVLENLKEGKALKYPIPRVMTVRFRGTGWQLATLYLSADPKYYLDISTATDDPFLITSGDLSEHIKLSTPLQPVDVQPESLLVGIDESIVKRVPVVPRVMMNFAEQFGQVGLMSIVPESIVVTGSQSMMRNIVQWHTLHRRFENCRGNIDEELPLEEQPMFAFDIVPSTVRLMVEVQPFAEKTISDILLETTTVPEGSAVQCIPSRIELVVRGGINQLAKLSPSDFHATLDFNRLISDSSGLVYPSITAPEGIKILRRTPDHVRFIIRKQL